MLDEVQVFWQNITPDMRDTIQTLGLAIAALLGGHILGSVVSRSLRAKKFDLALRLPSAAPEGAEAEHGFTPTFFAGMMVRLSVWVGAAWWLAQSHGRNDLANTLVLVLKRTWALAGLVATVLALGNLLARRVVDCLRGLTKAGVAVVPSRNGVAVPRGDLAGLVGAGIYFALVLLVLLIAADMFDWPLIRNSAQTLWQLGQKLLFAGAALFIGSLGARWARDLVKVEGTSQQERRAGHYTGLAIIGATTILSVAVLLSSAGLFMGLAILTIFAASLWLARGYLPDVTAGLQLRFQRVQEVWLDSEPWQVSEVGIVASQVSRRGEFCRLQNRVVLEASRQGAPQEAAAR